jgi:hypothetical protein
MANCLFADKMLILRYIAWQLLHHRCIRCGGLYGGAGGREVS